MTNVCITELNKSLFVSFILYYFQASGDAKKSNTKQYALIAGAVAVAGASYLAVLSQTLRIIIECLNFTNVVFLVPRYGI